MKITATEKFKKDFSSLPEEVRKAASKQISQLLLDHTHPSLRLENIEGHKGYFSARVNKRYRMALRFEKDDLIQLYRVLDHDEFYKSI